MDKWQERLTGHNSTGQILDQSHRIGIQFLIADLTLALTFLDVAKVTRSDEVRARNRENARLAYRTVTALEAKMTELKEGLLAVGCVI